MKSLYNVLQESIFDDDISISNHADNEIYQEMLKNIINAKSFNEYEGQISEFNELLKNNAELVSKRNKIFTQFKKDSIYLILLHKTGDFISEHSLIYIGNVDDNITYMVNAYEYVDTPDIIV